jgi:hypothetical protein
MNIQTAIQQPTCQNQGAITASVQGGNAPFTYQWSNGATGQTASNLAPGTYGLTVTDGAGCTATLSNMVVTAYTAMTLQSAIQQPTCQNQGAITASVQGGNAPYTYQWSNGATGQTASNLAPGTYSLTVTDGAGCTATLSNMVITAYTAMALQSAIQQPTCQNQGAITASVQGGNAPFTYQWSNGATGQTASNLAPGTYNLTVTDGAGCTATLSNMVITAYTAMTLQSAIQQPTCQNQGAITASVQGGNAPFTYQWSNGATGQTASNLAPGTYNLTVTDGAGCTATLSNMVVTAYTAMALQSAIQQPTCQNQGAITASVQGGNAPFTYQWSNGATGQTASNLAPGTYNLTVTDGAGCSATLSNMVITAYTAMALQSAIQQPTCQNQGAITASVQGGNAPFTYQWSNGATGQTASNLAPGTYSLTVTDGAGCSATLSNMVITAYTAMALQSAIQQPTCQNQGTITVSVQGGNAPYTYQWSNGATGQTASNLAPGTYGLTVTDGAGCTATLSNMTITAYATMSIQTALQQPTCQNPGSITATVQGGAAPYTYQWSNGATGQTASNLSAGTYSLTVTDGVGCTSTVAGISLQNAQAPAAVIATPGILNCNATTLTLSGTGSATGTNITYQWTTVAGQIISGANSINAVIGAPGIYNLTVTNVGNGCFSSASVTVQQAPELSLGINIINPIFCAGSEDGSAVAMVISGSAPFTFLWSNGQTSSEATNLPGGVHTVTVTDAYGCIATAEVALDQPTPLALTVSGIENPSCDGSANGYASVTAAGGTAPYQYLWSNGHTGAAAANLAPGAHSVTVTDSNGCATSTSVFLEGEDTTPPDLNLETGVMLFLDENGQAELIREMLDAGTFDDCGIQSWTITPSTFDCSDLGTVLVVVVATDLSGNAASAEVQITIADEIAPELECQADVEVTGCDGTVFYTMPEVWDNCGGGAAELISGYESGAVFPVGITEVVYAFTDPAGNTGTCSFTVTVPDALEGIVEKTDVTCFGDSNGTAEIKINGGTAPYEINWSNGATGAILEGLQAGLYLATVTDAAGCSQVYEVSIEGPDPISFTVDSTYYNPLTGQVGIEVTISGGVEPYSFRWILGGVVVAETEDLTGMLPPGSYILEVTDANGCALISDPIHIEEVTSTDEASAIDRNLSVYPNPTSGRLTIAIDGPQGDAGLFFQILDARGRKVFDAATRNAADLPLQLSLDELPTGVYFLQVMSKTLRAPVARKIMVQR